MKTEEEWSALITATLTEKGGDRYYTAICPICGEKETATSIGNEMGKFAARGKIASHITRAHQDQILPGKPDLA